MLKFEPGTPAVYAGRMPAITRRFDRVGLKAGLGFCHFGQTGVIFHREIPTIGGRHNRDDQTKVFFVPDGCDDVFLVPVACVYLGNGAYLSQFTV